MTRETIEETIHGIEFIFEYESHEDDTDDVMLNIWAVPKKLYTTSYQSVVNSLFIFFDDKYHNEAAFFPNDIIFKHIRSSLNINQKDLDQILQKSELYAQKIAKDFFKHGTL
jgi:hypothetical protein